MQRRTFLKASAASIAVPTIYSGTAHATNGGSSTFDARVEIPPGFSLNILVSKASLFEEPSNPSDFQAFLDVCPELSPEDTEDPNNTGHTGEIGGVVTTAYPSGTVLTRAKTIWAHHRVYKILTRRVRSIGLRSDALDRPEIVNAILNGEFGAVNLDDLHSHVSQSHRGTSAYDPSEFPALTYEISGIRGSALVFQSGRVTLMGGDGGSDARVLHRFLKRAVNTVQNSA